MPFLETDDGNGAGDRALLWKIHSVLVLMGLQTLDQGNSAMDHLRMPCETSLYYPICFGLGVRSTTWWTKVAAVQSSSGAEDAADLLTALGSDHCGKIEKTRPSELSNSIHQCFFSGAVFIRQ